MSDNKKRRKGASVPREHGTDMPRAAPGNWAGKLSGKIALITGGESKLGRAVAELFALEGAEISISCSTGHEEAAETKRVVESHDKKCLLLEGDQTDTCFCIDVVEHTLQEHGGLDILVNNTADLPDQPQTDSSEDPFGQNVLSTLFMTQSALFYLSEGGVILNTIPCGPMPSTPQFVDFLASRYAITNFTRTLARELAPKRIRVNAVAPDTRSGAPEDENMPGLLKPEEIAPSYLFLACADSSLMTGQVLYPNSVKGV